ncbi:carbonic anhydrase 4 isoform X2 [Paroedura picta]|uniref:carbonic anhydrase 4 isoform X2 n=1 Tax=Paroedura picta TaxID=143630 RepID=UPI004056087F
MTPASFVDWCYESQKCDNPHCQEPRKWVNLFPACGGKKQSPINIVTSKVEIDWNLKPFEFINYQVKQQTDWNITNTGHSVQVNLDGSAKIASGGLPSQYKAVQFHFHWGRGATKSLDMEPGAEHTIDGERYPMELHIVHIKEGYDMAEAIQNEGLAVLGFFVEIENENKGYTPLISNLNAVSSPGDKEQMAPLPLFSLIPPEEELRKYYRYHGSLTTPGCNEGVIWTLFEEPIKLSLAQIQEFWMKIYFNKTENLPMEDNFRPVQPVGERTVYKSDSAALVSTAMTWLLIPVATRLSLSFSQ